MKRFTHKVIRSGGNGFIHRWSLRLRNGSLKVHLILNDDKDEPHTHPWDFTSFLLLPYKETLNSGGVRVLNQTGNAYEEHRHWPLTYVRRTHDQHHKVTLYRLFGIRIPALTIGSYSKKLQLCSFCKDLGYCKEQGRP